MKNLLSTIPRGKFKDWATAERVCTMCDGTTSRRSDGRTDVESGQPWFWLINCRSLPKESGVGAVCFMLFDGLVRGYFDIVDTGLTESWRGRHGIGKQRTTQSLILANWHPIVDTTPVKGFQGYHYTHMHP